MASLFGFLSALGDSAGIGSPDQPNALARFNNDVDPVAAAQKQEALAQQSALAALAQNRQNGIINPQQNLSTLAQYDPQYTEKAASIQAQNPLAVMLQGSGADSGNSLANLTGDDLLKALPPAIAAQVKGYAEGKLQPSAYLMRSPQGQQLMQLVSQYDPTFDAANYPARVATRKSFTSGQDANNITALNTAMGHAASLKDAYDQLGNGDYNWLNSVENSVSSAMGNTGTQTALTNVQARSHALSEELAKVFRSTGMAESDVKAWEKQISTSATPAQSSALLNSAVELMNSRLDALGQKYNQGMGTTKQGIELLSPEAQKAYAKLTGNSPTETKASGDLNADNSAKSSDAQQITPEQAIAELKRRGKLK